MDFNLLATLFLVIVAPLWIIIHYVTRWRSSRSLSSDDQRVLEDMWRTAERIEQRVAVIEGILEEDSPGQPASGRSSSGRTTSDWRAAS